MSEENMDKLLSALEALKNAKEELEKAGVTLSWELVAVNKSSYQKDTTIDQGTCIGKPLI